MRGVLPLSLLLACVLSAAPASAQCRLCADPAVTAPSDAGPTGDVDLQIETSLNFDRLILSGSGPGAVTIRPDGSTGVEGSVLQAGPRAMVGTVLVHGIANRTLRVEIPRRIDLFSVSGAHMTLDDIRSDLPAVPRLDSAGNLSFRFGGRLIVSGDGDGPFRGDLPITVEYQ
jgi:hypothetical protein